MIEHQPYHIGADADPDSSFSTSILSCARDIIVACFDLFPLYPDAAIANTGACPARFRIKAPAEVALMRLL